MADNDFGGFGGFLPAWLGGGSPSAQPPAPPMPTSASDIAPPLAPGQTEQNANPNGWQTDVSKANWWQRMTLEQQKQFAGGVGKGFGAFGQSMQQPQQIMQAPQMHAPQMPQMGAGAFGAPFRVGGKQ